MSIDRRPSEWAQSLFVFVALLLVAVSTGCGASSSDPSPIKTLKAVSASPATASIAAGATQQFTATATYSDGSTANVTSTATWMSAGTGVATINASGMTTAVAAGSTTITASLSGMSGTAMLTVTAATKTITAIAVTPANPSITAGATQQFTATATYSDNSTANVTSTATWTSSNKAAATISAAGLATAVAAGSSTITASLSGVNGTAVLSVTAAVAKTITSIAVTPATPSIALGATQQFTATATYNDNSTANVSSTVNWTAANQDVATVNSAGLATSVASGSTSITASVGGVSETVPFVVTIAPGTGVNVVTYHFDSNRSGLNPGEQSLTPANVSPQTFGKLFSYLVDGYVYGQPLLVSNLTIDGGKHNVLYVATENDSVYAFDADNYGTGAPLWQVSLLQTGERPIGGSIAPYEGVTSTPVIDLTTNTIYVVSVEVKAGSAATFRLNALDLTTGAQKFGGPVVIQASVAGTNAESVNGVDSLAPLCLQRAALLLANGTVYIGFGSCHQGWLLAYDAQTLAQTGVFNASPNLNGEGTYAGGGGIWMGGDGPAADSAGNVYVTTGNGPWDGQTAWGDSVLKFNAQLQMEDYFTPQDYQYMDCNDADLAGGGLMLIPGTTEALAGGKSSKLYLVNTANLGHEQANDAGASQAFYLESDLLAPYVSSCTDSLGTHSMDVDSYEDFGTAAYFNGSVYLGVTPYTTVLPAGLRQFTYSAGTLTPGAYIAHNIQESSYGTTPFISANGTSNGILWMIDHGSPIQSSTPTSATLYAYDASDPTKELYSSSTNAGDVPGYGIKFTSPIVANGKVYITTGHDLSTVASPRGEIDVYGLK
ncbi:MAG: Ig-like domain-containing protein [Acidobacteriaceae bacterium]